MFKNLLLYIWPLIYLFVLGNNRFFTTYICFKETLFSNFSYIPVNKYFSLLQSSIPVPYPELFWSWYTCLGSQTQTPKRLKVLISGVSFCQHSLSQSQESDVLSYSECKIAKNFQGFVLGPHWGGLTVLPQTPQLYNSFSPCYTRWKTSTPQKLLDTALHTTNLGCRLKDKLK